MKISTRTIEPLPTDPDAKRTIACKMPDNALRLYGILRENYLICTTSSLFVNHRLMITRSSLGLTARFVVVKPDSIELHDSTSCEVFQLDEVTPIAIVRRIEMDLPI